MFWNKISDWKFQWYNKIRRVFSRGFWIRFHTRALFEGLGGHVLPGWTVWRVPFDKDGYTVVRTWTWPFFWLYDWIFDEVLYHHWDRHFSVNFLGMIVLGRFSTTLALTVCIAASIGVEIFQAIRTWKWMRKNYGRAYSRIQPKRYVYGRMSWGTWFLAKMITRDTLGDFAADSVGILLGWICVV